MVHLKKRIRSVCIEMKLCVHILLKNIKGQNHVCGLLLFLQKRKRKKVKVYAHVYTYFEDFWKNEKETGNSMFFPDGSGEVSS